MEDWTKYFSSFKWDRFEKIDQSQNWFKVFRIMPDTFAIWEPWHREMVISYLIIGTRHTLLFDTGLGIGDIKKLVVELGFKNIIVLNSHSHWDHIGGNFQFNCIYGLNNEYARQNCQGEPYSQAKHYLINTVIDIESLFTCHRQTAISSLYLKRMHEAFKEIKSTIGPTIDSEQEKEVQFDGFSVIV
ncbi:MAG: MBL fold metallo-hydrolase [bacterium]|nr:MBL fold metallo-hydrolase [bacterium]